MRPFRFRGHKTIQELLDSALGRLEREVMATLWDGGDMTVRKVCDRLDSVVPYTTVMTTMDRLFKMGLLRRRKIGQAFLYSASVTRRELDHSLAVNAVGSILQPGDRDPLPILSLLVDTVSAMDPLLLDDLERLVQEKRKRRQSIRPA